MGFLPVWVCISVLEEKQITNASSSPRGRGEGGARWGGAYWEEQWLMWGCSERSPFMAGVSKVEKHLQASAESFQQLVQRS